MDEPLPQVFGRRVAAFIPRNDLPRGSIVFNDNRMIDRDIRNALIEIGNRIPTSRHDFRDQTVRFIDGAARVVDKQCLHVMPYFPETCRFVGGELANLEASDTLLARRKVRFGSADLHARCSRSYA